MHDGVELGHSSSQVIPVQDLPCTGQRQFDLPPEIDALLVAQGYKGKTGAYALNTLVHRLAVLSKAHQKLKVDNPCNHTQVRELLKNARSGHAKRGVKPHKQAALTKEPLQAVLATCDESPRGNRDRALLLFGWAVAGGAARRSPAPPWKTCARSVRAAISARSPTPRRTRTVRSIPPTTSRSRASRRKRSSSGSK